MKGQYIPPGVQEELDALTHATGGRGEIERVGDRKWRVIVANERVRVTMDLKTTGPGRWVWAGSTLQVDGEPRPLAKGLQELGRIFRNPDGADDSGQEPAEPDPMPAARPAEEAPVLVAQQYRTLASHLGDKGEIRLGGDDTTWVIRVTMPLAVLQMRFVVRRGECSVDRRRPLQLIIDGRDRTAEIKGDLAKALALIGKHGGEAAPHQPAVGRPASSARSNAVETRRSTVIRV